MNKSEYVQLSIIVPVFNVEKYIRPCIESIFQQGLEEDTFEVIIVNDGTKDRSLEVIQDFINLHKNINIIHQENLGLSVARNNGITAAKGEYILMPDSDDLLIGNSLKPFLEKAIETKVDLVVADYLDMNNEEIESLDTHTIQRPKEILFVEKTGKRLFMENMNIHQCYIWRILFRKEFLIQQHIAFIPGIYVQDKPFFYESYLKADKCLIASWPIYIYRRHSGGVSLVMSEKFARSYCIAISKMWELTYLPELSTDQRDKMIDYTYKTVSSLTCRLVYELKDKYMCTEIIDYLNQVAPHLNFPHGLEQRLITFLINKMPHTYIDLRFLYADIWERRTYPFIKRMLRILS